VLRPDSIGDDASGHFDVGTDNPERLADPLYIGWRHERIRDAHYDEFVDAFVAAVMKRWPHVLLQWEDFARPNANRLLARYRDRLCTFNDDIQGTAAVAAARCSRQSTSRSAARVTAHCCLRRRLCRLWNREPAQENPCRSGPDGQRGARPLFLVDRSGLLLDGTPEIESFQCEFVRSRDSVAGWTLQNPDTISLYDVVRNAKPTVLIGVSGQSGGFPEHVVRAMAVQTERPVIFPLSIQRHVARQRLRTCSTGPPVARLSEREARSPLVNATEPHSRSTRQTTPIFSRAWVWRQLPSRPGA